MRADHDFERGVVFLRRHRVVAFALGHELGVVAPRLGEERAGKVRVGAEAAEKVARVKVSFEMRRRKFGELTSRPGRLWEARWRAQS